MDPEQERIAKTFDAYNEQYSSAVTDAVTDAIGVPGLDADFFVRAKAEYLRDLVTHNFPDRDNLTGLDLGCGVGLYHSPLENLFATLHGVDVSVSCLERAAALHPQVNYQAYDGKTLPFADNSLDVVFTICVMHHVPVDHWERFVGEMFRVLKPGGLILIFEHNPFNPVTRRIVSNCEFDADAVLVKPTVARRILTRSGFADVATNYILTIPSTNAWVRHVDRLFSSLPFGAQYFAKAFKPVTD